MNDIKVINSELFKKFPEIKFGFSTKVGLGRQHPFHYNMSFTVGDVKERVIENRQAFFNEIGLSIDTVAYQLQIHSDIITCVNEDGFVGESDALITTKPNLGLAISSADCVPIFIYDPIKKVIGAVHSGWRGTQKQILQKVLQRFSLSYDSSAKNLVAYVGPSISQKNYEVGSDVAVQFHPKYVAEIEGKICLDVIGINYDMLTDFGIPEKNIELSPLCSYAEENLLHSYRREGVKSGRALGVIALAK